MKKIAIITDSTCDLPQALIEQYRITVLPQYVIWGNQEFRDRIDLQPEEFYQRLQTDPQRPTSSLVTASDFARAYARAAQEGAQEILTITLSSAMSGTYQAALNAAEAAPIPVQVIDAKGPTMSLGWQVLAVARLLECGEDVPALVAKAEAVRRRLVQLVGLDTIEYLQRGGRTGNAAKWVGGLLHIRPIVTINHTSGLVDPLGMARTYKNMVDMLYQKFFEKIGDAGHLHVAVLHGNAPDEAEALAERIQRQYAPAELLINITGPVLGMNTGPRALALCGYGE